MATASFNAIKGNEDREAKERVSMERRPFEVALGEEDCKNLTELLNKAEYGRDGIGQGRVTRKEVAKIVDYHLQIMDFVKKNYFKFHESKGKVEYSGPLEMIEGEECYVGYADETDVGLPRLPKNKWVHYMEHIDTIIRIHLYGADSLANVR